MLKIPPEGQSWSEGWSGPTAFISPPRKQGGEVVLYAIEGGGHTWPGGYQYLPERWVGKTCGDIDANEVIWNFFKKKSLTD